MNNCTINNSNDFPMPGDLIIRFNVDDIIRVYTQYRYTYIKRRKYTRRLVLPYYYYGAMRHWDGTSRAAPLQLPELYLYRFIGFIGMYIPTIRNIYLIYYNSHGHCMKGSVTV